MMHKLDINALYVEDDKVTEIVISEILKKKIENIDIAFSGEEAIQKFNKKKYDIIITDINLPKISGIELAQYVKSNSNDIEIMAISSINDQKKILEAINSGINYFLIKPIKVEEFYSVLEKIHKRLVEKRELEDYRENLETLVQARTIRLKDANEKLREEIRNREKMEEQAIVLYRAIEQSPSIIILTDTTGVIEYVNLKFEKIIGEKRENIIGKKWWRVIENNRTEDILKVIKDKNIWEGEVVNTIGDEKKYLYISVAPVYYFKDDCSHFVISIENITERKEMEKEIISAKEKAEAVNKAKSRFLANMSHEIRTPMNGVIMMSDILINSGLENQQLKVAQLLKNSAKSLLRIINDILDFSKMEAGKMELDEGNFLISDIIQDIMEMFEILARNKNLDIRYHIDSGIPNELVGDYKRLKQVLINLVGNALKFTEKGRISLDIKKEKENQDKVTLTFIIKDTGIGISEKKLENIFEDFEQGDSSYTKKYEGTGLGLAISKSIIKLMKGHIGVKSQEGVGSEFHFTVSLYKVTKTYEEKKEYKFDFLRERLVNKNLKILVAEDNEINQVAISSLLKSNYCEVDIANDGVEVIEKWKTNKYDLILMDIQMPRINGMEATKKIREIETKSNLENMPIIALTAYAMPEDIKKFLKAGVDDYIVKPIKFEKLYGKIVEILEL